MRYAANLSMLYGELPLLARPAAAAADGFTAAEILFPYDVELAPLRAALDDAGVSVVLINTPPGAPDERGLAAVVGAEARFRSDFDRALDAAERLGAATVHTMAGLVGTGLDGLAAARATLLANLRWAAPRAAARGIGLTLEALNRNDVPGYFYAVPTQVVEILSELDEPNVGLQFDLYHAAKERLRVQMEMEATRRWIRHVQIAGPPDRHEPTEADQPLFDALGWLERSGYDGWVGFEYRPRAGTSEGLGWRRLLPVTPS